MAATDVTTSYPPRVEQNGTDFRNGDPPFSGTSSLLDEKVEPVAVVGFSARLPQEATTGEAFWKMLSEGRSVVTEIPKERFNIDAFYHPNAERSDAVGCELFMSLTSFCHLTSKMLIIHNRPTSRLATS